MLNSDELAKANRALIDSLTTAGFTSDEIVNKKFSDLTPAKQKALITILRNTTQPLIQTRANLDVLTRAYAKLLNNQPQPYASLFYHERKNIVGPSETVLKATYEYGFKNLNTFMGRYRAKCDSLLINDTTAGNCVDLIEKYAGDTGPDASSDDGRISASLEYHAADATHIDLPAYSFTLDTKSGHSLVASLTGGYTMMPRPDRKSGRIDVMLSYENIKNAAVIPSLTNPPADVKDRFVAAITFTQKITDTLSFPVSLIYANHASFLTNVDRKLNAHFGLQYKLPTGL